jgi:uncharacterized phage-associated protein
MNLMEVLGFGRIPTHFDERKTAAAASFLLAKAGRRMEYIRLLKLLYMADREAWGRYGRPITGDRYVSMTHGPVLSQTYDLIKTDASGAWHQAVERTGGYDVALRGDPDLGPLSEAETDILAEVHDRFQKVGTWDLVEYLHKTLPEWKETKGSVDLDPEDILRALGKGDQIKAVRKDMEELEDFRRMLGAH